MGHPYGVLPELEDVSSSVREKGLGLFAKLPDELLVSILGMLPPKDLTVMSTASHAIYCFSNHEELWKAIVFEEFKDDWEYTVSWQETYLRQAVPSYRADSKHPRPMPGLRSDLLYQSWLCSVVEVDPSWLEIGNVDRRSGLTIEEFKAKYEVPNRPVILTDQVTKWPAMKKWTREYLAKQFQGNTVLVGDAPMTYERYCRYADSQHDELPLYLFDKGFAEASPGLAADYTVPPHFSDEDLFALLGPARPDYRWLIIGPARSGSTFHVDPNQTCAWNAVVAGSKKWLLYPPSHPPPGVTPSADNVDVASPVSLMEWFLKFYNVRDAGGVQPLECTVRPGEVLFVPRGWWHAALNLEDDTIAVTQNYVCSANLRQVLQFLGTRNPDLVSGLDKEEDRVALYDRFLAALKEKNPQVLKEIKEEEQRRKQRAEADSKLSSMFKTSPGSAPNPTTFNQNNNTALATDQPASGFAFKFSF